MSEDKKEKMEFTDEMREQARLLFPMNSDETFSFKPEMYKALPKSYWPTIELRPMNTGEKEQYQNAFNRAVYGSMSPEFMDETGLVSDERDKELESAKTEKEKEAINKRYDKKIESVSKKYISQTMTKGNEENKKLEQISLNCVVGWSNFYSFDLENLIDYKGKKSTGLDVGLRSRLHKNLVQEIVKKVSDISGLASVELTGLGY